jgi:hypothetical protein
VEGTMSKEYIDELREQYQWYIDRISEIHRGNQWHCIPTDSFHYKLSFGRITPKLDNIEWLEYALPKLQSLLALIEAHIEREKYKQLFHKDLMSALKNI